MHLVPVDPLDAPGKTATLGNRNDWILRYLPSGAFRVVNSVNP